MTRQRLPIEVRNRRYTYDESADLVHYDSENIVLTHEWNALDLIIPGGEQYFVRSVQRLAAKAKDPGLKSQIKGFIGQEAMHSKETNRSMELLENRGIPVKKFQMWQERVLRWLERLPFPRLHLAGTAAAEHYTTVFSIWHLGNRYCDKFPPAIRDLCQWHAAEELEHKAVAFDLLQEIAPRNYPLRILGFLISMTVTWLCYRKALRLLLEFEGLSPAQIREERKRARAIRIPLLSLRFPGLLSYLKPGFHPNHLEDGGLGRRILEEQASRAHA